MATTPDRRLPDSGIEVKPLYRAADAPAAERRAAGRLPVHARPVPGHVPRAGRGRCASTRASRSAEETNERYRYLLARGQTGLSVAFDLPTQLGYDSDDAVAAGEVGRTGVAIDSLADMELLLDGHPARRGLDVDDDQRAGGAPAPPATSSSPRSRASRATALRGTVQNDILKEYVARGQLHLPAAPVDAARRPTCSRTARSESRAGTRSRSPATTSARPGSTAAQELAFTLANGIAYCEAAVARGPLPRRVRRAALVLLQRPQRLLRGGREVPRGAHAVGRDHARPLRRHDREGAGAALPRPDRRLDADGAAAGEQHRPGRDPGARPPSAAARSRCTRTAFDEALALPTEHAATIALRTQQILMHEAGTTDTADPLGGSYYVEALTDELEARARELIERIDELGGAVAAIEAGFVQGEIEEAAYRFQRAVETGERVVVGVNALHRRTPERTSSSTASTPRASSASASARRASAPSATPRPRRRSLAVVRERRRTGRTCCRRSARRSARAARSASSAARSASSGVPTTRSIVAAPDSPGSRGPGSRSRRALAPLALARGDDEGASANARPSFATDVAPIVAAKCAGCHRPGGIAPFALGHRAADSSSAAAHRGSRAGEPDAAVAAREALAAVPSGRAADPERAERASILAWARGRREDRRSGRQAVGARGPRRASGEALLDADEAGDVHAVRAEAAHRRLPLLPPRSRAAGRRFVTSRGSCPARRHRPPRDPLQGRAAQVPDAKRLDGGDAGPGLDVLRRDRASDGGRRGDRRDR